MLLRLINTQPKVGDSVRLLDLKSLTTEKPRKVFLTQTYNSITMKPIVTSKKWLLSGISWLIAMVSSMILLIVFYGRDSINIHKNILGLIPNAFQIMLVVSFIMFFFERRNEKRVHAYTKADA
jgi:hypothetical protein